MRKGRVDQRKKAENEIAVKTFQVEQGGILCAMGVFVRKRKNEYKKEAVYKYALLKAKSLGVL